MLKRGLLGTYHHVSVKHLGKYVNASQALQLSKELGITVSGRPALWRQCPWVVRLNNREAGHVGTMPSRPSRNCLVMQ